MWLKWKLSVLMYIYIYKYLCVLSIPNDVNPFRYYHTKLHCALKKVLNTTIVNVMVIINLS